MKREIANPYVYPGTNTRVNIYYIQKADVLQKVENEMIHSQLSTLRKMECSHLDYERYKEIHRHLFKGLYEWAGKEREVEMGRANILYCNVKDLELKQKEIFGQLKNENFLKGLGTDEFSKKAAETWKNLSLLSPFPHGNTEANHEFMRELAKNAGYDLNLEKVLKAEISDVNLKALEGKSEELEQLIKNNLKPLQTLNISNDSEVEQPKVQTINQSYVYPGTTVKVNLYDIQDKEVLQKVERRMVAYRLVELQEMDQKGFGYERYKEIHHHLYKDLYDWAGKERNLEMSKLHLKFCNVKELGAEQKKIFEQLKNENFLQDLGPDEFSKKAAETWKSLTQLSPFPHGNTETNHEYMREIAKNAGYELELTHVPSREIDFAGRKAMLGDSKPFEQLIQDNLKPLRQMEMKDELQEINLSKIRPIPSNSPYDYPGTCTRINLKNIQDVEKLQQVEKRMVDHRLSELRDIGKNSLSYESYKGVHRHIYKDLYEWAGKERTVEMAGTAKYCSVKDLDATQKKIFDNLKNENYLKGLGPDEFSKKAADTWQQLNKLSPFAHGNNEVNREFLRSLAKNAGYELELSRAPRSEIANANRKSMLGNSEGYEKLIRNNLKPTLEMVKVPSVKLKAPSLSM